LLKFKLINGDQPGLRTRHGPFNQYDIVFGSDIDDFQVSDGFAIIAIAAGHLLSFDDFGRPRTATD
jgi:hypothetical protein